MGQRRLDRHSDPHDDCEQISLLLLGEVSCGEFFLDNQRGSHTAARV
jgi:hypothetical protein